MSQSKKSSSILVQSLPRCEAEVVENLPVEAFVREEAVRESEIVSTYLRVGDEYQPASHVGA
jgi:hypothetical protein